MSFRNFTKLIVLSTVLLFNATANANENGNTIVYIGAGSNTGDKPTTGTSTPFTIGFLNLSSGERIWGLDIAGEGVVIDSTWGMNKALTQSSSLNLIFGKPLNTSMNSRLDGGLLVGMRRKTSDCPRSSLGYQCYADSSPNTTYDLNYGGLITWTSNSLMLGVRLTGASSQLLVGYRF